MLYHAAVSGSEWKEMKDASISCTYILTLQRVCDSGLVTDCENWIDFQVHSLQSNYIKPER